jgi:hypothetical protein
MLHIARNTKRQRRAPALECLLTTRMRGGLRFERRDCSPRECLSVTTSHEHCIVPAAIAYNVPTDRLYLRHSRCETFTMWR